MRKVAGLWKRGKINMDLKGDIKGWATKIKEGSLTPEEALKEFNQKNQTGRSFKSKGQAERLLSYTKAREQRDHILKNRIPFIHPNFIPDFYMSQGAVLVGAQTGKGKSSIAGNICAGIIKHCESANILYISNEENVDAIYERIAAVILKKSFYSIHHGSLSVSELEKVREFISTNIVPRVEVITEEEFNTHTIEDVKLIFESCVNQDVKAVILDYHQNVNQSRLNRNKESFQISKELGEFYRDFGRKHGIPIFVLCQLSAKGDNGGFKDRVENDKTLINHAFCAIEAVPDFENGLTKFIIQKDRFMGSTGKTVEVSFNQGRYEIDEGVKAF